jgi:hypothetical protein
MNSPAPPTFWETGEYHRFGEFCEACRRYRYIGLCYGPPGVGKTLSARYYTRWDRVAAYQGYPRPSPVALASVLDSHAVFYTTPVVNSPKQIARAIERLRQHLLQIRRDEGRAAEDAQLAQLQRAEQEQERQRQQQLWLAPDRFAATAPNAAPGAVDVRFGELAREYELRRRAIPDPTDVVVVDEADRLKLAGLEPGALRADAISTTRGAAGWCCWGCRGWRSGSPVTRNSTLAWDLSTRSGNCRLRKCSRCYRTSGRGWE